MSTNYILYFFREMNLGGYVGGAILIIAAIMFLAACLQCFLGFKMFKFWIAVCGFFTFGFLGGVLGAVLLKSPEMGVICGIIFAILGAFAAYKLYLVGVFILCGFIGFLLGFLLSQSPEFGAIFGVIIGIISVVFVKPVIIISTSFSGGMAAGSSLCLLLGIWNTYVELIIGTLFFIFGMIVQFSTNKSKPKMPYMQPMYAAPMYNNPQNNNINNQVTQTQPSQVNTSTGDPTALGNQVTAENTMAFCTKCGSPIKKADKFCTNCGTQSRSTSM